LVKNYFSKGQFAIVVKKDISGITFESLKNEFKKLTGKIN
jgi:hypothetical protein